MDKNNSCSKKCIQGIVCDVTNCVYHDKENKCTAEQILVGPTYANASSDTACVTFKQKTDI